MQWDSGNLPDFTLRFVFGFLFLFVVGFGIGACSSGSKLTETTSPPLAPAEPKLTRSIFIESVDGDVELFPSGKDLPAIASETFIYAKGKQDSARVTIYQSAGSLRETIVDVDLLVAPMKDSNIVITVSVDSQKQLRLKTSVMESAVVKEFGPFPVE